MRPLRARYTRRGSGWEVTASVKGQPVVATGRTLERARMAVVAELADRLGTYSGAVAVDDEFGVSRRASAALDLAMRSRSEALRAAAESQRTTTRAARLLVDEGVSLRDVAYLLGLSHSRVQQLVERNTP